MSSQLSEQELASLMPSELVQHQTPIPTQIVSSDEFYPDPQNERQREVEARLLAMAGWNKQLAEREQTIEDLKYANYKKEMFLDSDTKISLISSAPSDVEQDWFLTNEQMAEARKKMNDEAGSRRLLAHCIFTPGQPGWLDKLQAALELKPDSCKGYTIGDNTHK